MSHAARFDALIFIRSPRGFSEASKTMVNLTLIGRDKRMSDTDLSHARV